MPHTRCNPGGVDSDLQVKAESNKLKVKRLVQFKFKVRGSGFKIQGFAVSLLALRHASCGLFLPSSLSFFVSLSPFLPFTPSSSPRRPPLAARRWPFFPRAPCSVPCAPCPVPRAPFVYFLYYLYIVPLLCFVVIVSIHF